ncbi:MAG: arylsulfotransferase family protein [Planctomycetota bacterium]
MGVDVRVERSRVATALACAAALACGRGNSPTDAPADDTHGWVDGAPGLFSVRRAPIARDPLGSIGYAPGSEARPPAVGVLAHDSGRTASGVNLMCSGDAAAAELVDMDGTRLHRWSLPFEALDGAPPLEGEHQIPWRRVHLLDDGGLLAIHSGRALVRVTRASALVWARFERFHHDLAVTPDGTVLALAREESVVPRVHPPDPIVDDVILAIGSDGEIAGRVSLWDAFVRSEWADMLDFLTVRTGDVMHANSLELIDGKAAQRLDLPGVEAGQVLVCMRDLDLVATVDLAAGRLTWLSQGPAHPRWRAPHDPTVAADGTILVFDNRGGPAESSRVLRFDPTTAAVRWTWRGTPPSSFATYFCGTAQELANGNVLATESMQGRAVEIEAASGDVVWEYVSDRVAGPNDEYVAALFAVERVDGPSWLER